MIKSDLISTFENPYIEQKSWSPYQNNGGFVDMFFFFLFHDFDSLMIGPLLVLLEKTLAS